MKKSLALLILLALAPVAARAEGELPLIGQDEAGAPIEVVIPRRQYTARLARLVEATELSAEPALASIRERQSWMLRTVVVGVGLGLTVGLGPIVELNATPRFRLAFSNGLEPVLP